MPQKIKQSQSPHTLILNFESCSKVAISNLDSSLEESILLTVIDFSQIVLSQHSHMTKWRNLFQRCKPLLSNRQLAINNSFSFHHLHRCDETKKRVSPTSPHVSLSLSLSHECEETFQGWASFFKEVSKMIILESHFIIVFGHFG